MNRRYIQRADQRKGFTIIELMLAMSFVAILLISVAVLTINISKLYSRGVTYKELNQVGSEVANDIRRSVAAAQVDNIKFVNTDPSYRLCLGNYSYIWNKRASGGASTIQYKGADVQLVKVTDPGDKYCTAAPTYPASVASTDEVKELLVSGGNRDLYVYNISVNTLSTAGAVGIATPQQLASKRALYTIKITLGTADKNQINIPTGRCNAPGGVNGGDEYCAIDTFTVVVAVGNTSKN